MTSTPRWLRDLPEKAHPIYAATEIQRHEPIGRWWRAIGMLPPELRAGAHAHLLGMSRRVQESLAARARRGVAIIIEDDHRGEMPQHADQ